ncbi:MAG: Hsp20 family protein [Hyphomicrobiales bacterium]|nr:Hsp20 family protein [Hyphomicrobiales bacterium]MBV9517118.1 Hsp20 family protein [Hyphomicrobiales bacterium]
MTTYDFTPLFRSSIGFDRLPLLLSHALQLDESTTSYPPYNIDKCSEDEYRIVMAVAGFGTDDIEIVSEQNKLTVRGEIKEREEKNYLHRGIAARSFQRQFDLADFVKVNGAELKDGLLVISLKREIPEEMKPRRIEIGGGGVTRLAEKSGGKKGEKQTAA